MNTKIQANPYIVKENPNEDKLSNTLTGEKILCGEKIIELILFLKEPKDLASIEGKFEEIKEELPQLIQTLLLKKFLFEEDKIEDSITTITPCNPHLYNLPYLSKSKKQQLIDKAIVFVGVPLGIGNKSNSSSSLYPNSFRNYLAKYGLKLDKESFLNFKAFNSEFENVKMLKDEGRLFDLGNVFFDLNESPTFCYQKIETIARGLFKEATSQLPFFIGGDHSISFPIIKAAIDQYGDDLCVIHFDAHTDTYDSPYSQIKHNQKIHHHGNFLTKCFESGLRHAYQFGIRGIVNCNHKENIHQSIFWCNELKNLIKENDSFSSLPKNKKYYVTFDFDVLDPLCFSGTTTPVIDGLTLNECAKLIELVLKDKEIIGIDIVELYTDKGELNQTHQIANYIILQLLNVLV
jgi:agmatinase